MNELFVSALSGLAIMLFMGFLTWLYSLIKNDVSIVDSLWSLMFLAVSVFYALENESMTEVHILFLVLVAFWSLRLSVLLTLRNWDHAEDRRYRDIRANNQPFFNIKSLYIVFGLQALLAWIISTPLLSVFYAQSTIGTIEIIATTLWLAGFVFESVADFQLYYFKKQSVNKDQVLQKGLWAYSRHPNYFGECLIWWAFYLFAFSAGAWWTIFAPVLMTLLLLKVSGVSLMEKDISGRRPKYADYIKSTNAFIPGLPKAVNRSYLNKVDEA